MTVSSELEQNHIMFILKFFRNNRVSPDQADKRKTISALLHHRELLGNHEKYADAVAITMNDIQEINRISPNELKKTLKRLNALLTTFSIPIIREGQEKFFARQKNNLCLESDLRTSILSKLKQSTDTLEKNIFHAFLLVHDEMDKNQQDFRLVYNQIRHTAEMFEDLALLLSDEGNHPEMHLLILLCGLFSKSVFRRSRINDETQSAEALMRFLEPIIQQMSPEEQSNIKKLIYIFIVGGATPAFFTKDTSGNELPTIESVFKIAHHLLLEQERNRPNYLELAHFAGMLADVNIQRTSIVPILNGHVESDRHQDNSHYHSRYWNLILEKFYSFLNDSAYQDIDSSLLKVSLQRKLTEGLRMIYEGIGSTTDHPLEQLRKCVTDFQVYGNHNIDLILNEKQILLFAKEFKDSTEEPNVFAQQKFAERLSHSSEPLQNRSYSFCNTWLIHAQILENIYQYLMNREHSLQEKTQLVIALAQVAENQDGKSLSVEKIQTISAQLETQMIATMCASSNLI